MKLVRSQRDILRLVRRDAKKSRGFRYGLSNATGISYSTVHRICSGISDGTASSLEKIDAYYSSKRQ